MLYHIFISYQISYIICLIPYIIYNISYHIYIHIYNHVHIYIIMYIYIYIYYHMLYHIYIHIIQYIYIYVHLYQNILSYYIYNIHTVHKKVFWTPFSRYPPKNITSIAFIWISLYIFCTKTIPKTPATTPRVCQGPRVNSTWVGW